MPAKDKKEGDAGTRAGVTRSPPASFVHVVKVD
jgi:hypothetical protein